MSQNNNHERLTRKLAYMLRHQPDEFDVEVDKFGYADLEDVLDALSEELDEDIEEEDVSAAIEAGDRPRYEIVDGKIRALYGHSIKVDPGEPTEPPEELYLGMGSRDADRATKSGLSAGRRRFLHLATSEEDAKEMGRRAAPEYTVVTVFARDAWEDGVSFYDRKALFLSDAIPTEHLEVGEVYTDGERRERRGRGGRDRGGRDRGGRDRGGRNRGGGRDDRSDNRSDSRSDNRSDSRSDNRSDSRSGGDSDRGRGRGDSRRDDRRDERPARREEAPAQEAPVQEAPVETAPAAADSGGFGGGVSSDETAQTKREERAPEPVMEHAPEPVMEPAPELVPAPETKEEPDPGAGFGSGL